MREFGKALYNNYPDSKVIFYQWQNHYKGGTFLGHLGIPHERQHPLLQENMLFMKPSPLSGGPNLENLMFKWLSGQNDQ